MKKQTDTTYKHATTDQKVADYVAGIKECSERVVVSTATARSFLVSTGIYTVKGNLSSCYKQ